MKKLAEQAAVPGAGRQRKNQTGYGKSFPWESDERSAGRIRID